MDDIIQLKITLNGSKPPIWRRLLVDKTTTFFNLHHIIQIAMGWTDSHLHEFNINGVQIAGQNEMFDDDIDDDDIDASTVKLEDFIKKPKDKFVYSYDFGDGWEHQIVVEKFLPRNTELEYPRCIAGELNCPPEDCGGIWGFYSMLEVIKDKKHPEHKMTLEWIGEDYDPDYFNKDDVNEELLDFEDIY